MTAPKTQIQALINKIDEVLQASDSTRKRSHPMEDTHQQQVLEQARNYLASLQSGTSSPIPDNPPSIGKGPSLPPVNTASQPVPSQPDANTALSLNPGMITPAESAQQVLQAIVQEMNYLRVNMMQPLREELMTLYQQRQLLTADIQRLEQQRYQLLLSQQQFNQQQVIQDFLQSLMGRLQEQMATQIAQAYANAEFQAHQLPPSDSASTQPQLTPGQRLQHMQQLQSQSDEIMLKLDSTLRVVFNSLQTNIDSYQDSLSQGLEKMHNLGQRGEVMFAALVNRLAEHVGRGASYYLQSSMQKEWELPGLGSVEGPDGGFIPRHPVRSDDQVSVPDKLPDDQLNQIINRLADSVQDDVESDSLSELDDGLIDELLGTLGANPNQIIDGVDFNLDDVDLPSDTNELLDDASFDAGMPPSGSIGDDLTLFEIADDGVHTHIDEERITQIQEAETDSFLKDLDAAREREQNAGQSTSMDEMADSYSPASDDEDEALAFLDQVAAEMEQDLNTALSSPSDTGIGATEPDISGADISGADISGADISGADIDSIVPEHAEGGAQPSSASSAQHPLPAEIDADIVNIESLLDTSEASRDEVDAFYQMFDEPLTPTPSSSGESTPPILVDEADVSSDQGLSDPTLANVPSNEHGTDHPLEQPPDRAEPFSSYADDVESVDTAGLLSDLFGDGEDELDDFSFSVLDAASAQPSVDLAVDDEDLFSELGLNTQGMPYDLAEDASERIETISSLAELIDDGESKDSLDEASGLTPSGQGTGPDTEDELYLGSGSDQYTVASPDEDLLAADEVTSFDQGKIPLDEQQRQRLARDLAEVEGLDPSEVLTNQSNQELGSTHAKDKPYTDEAGGDDAPLSHEAIDGFLTPDDAFFSEDESGDKFGNESGDKFGGDRATTLDEFSTDMAGEADHRSDDGSEVESVEDLFGDALSDAPSPSSSPSPFQTSPPVANEEVPRYESSPDMTVDTLFEGMGEPGEPQSEGDRPDPFTRNPFDADDELQGIFEDLQALNNLETEASYAQEEKTLLDLMKGFNQPTLPPLNEPSPSSPSQESDISWSFFDDVNDPGDSDDQR